MFLSNVSSDGDIFNKLRVELNGQIIVLNLKIFLDFIVISLYNRVRNIININKESDIMKLVLAIVNDEDGNKVLNALSKAGFSVTKLATTGGFLKAGNMTLLIGIEDDKVDEVIGIIKDKSQRRKQITASPMPMGASASFTPYPIEIQIGGATIFVLDVDRFEKV